MQSPFFSGMFRRALSLFFCSMLAGGVSVFFYGCDSMRKDAASDSGGLKGQEEAPYVLIAPEEGDSIALQKAITEAFKGGAHKVVIAPGTYRLRPAKEGPYLHFENFSDFEIEASGVRFICSEIMRGRIEFKDCRNVTLRGLELQTDPIPQTQGTVEAIAPDDAWCDIKIHKGYKTDLDNPKSFQQASAAALFDSKTRLFKEGGRDISYQKVERLGEDLFRIHLRNWPLPDWAQKEPKLRRMPIEVGDFLAFRSMVRSEILVYNCAGMNIDKVAFLSSPGFVVHEVAGDGGSRYSYTVTGAPKPEGGTEAPLLAASADGFHSNFTRKGPLIENCLFERMHDDGININGHYATLMESSGKRIVALKSHEIPYRKGDGLRLFDKEGRPAGEALILEISELKGYKPPKEADKSPVNKFYEIILDKELPGEFGFLISDPEANGKGYVIRNNTIRNNRGRGLLLHSDAGLVEGNLIEGCTSAGIVVTPELSWGESCFSRDLAIRGNTIRHVGYAACSGVMAQQPGALCISAFNAENGLFLPSEGHRKILVEENSFIDNPGVNILISSASDVVLRKNKFKDFNKSDCETGAKIIDPHYLIWMTQCRNVKLEGNLASGKGAFCKGLCYEGPGVSGVSGIDGGIIEGDARK